MNWLLFPLLLSAILPRERDGIAKWYSKGVMEHVYGVRIRQGLAAPGWTGPLVAVPECSSVGRVVLFSLNGRPVQRGLVVDCSQTRDYWPHVRERLWLETDYRTARNSGSYGDGRGRVRVWYYPESWYSGQY